MATVSKGYTFGSTEQVTNAKLHSLVDSATVTGIVNADIALGAAIIDAKLNAITTANKVSGQSLYALANIPSGAGDIPKANLDGDWDTDGTLTANSDVKLATQKATKTYSDTKIANPASGARGDILYHNGTNYVRLPKGTNGQYLKIGANDPAWAAVSKSSLGIDGGTQAFNASTNNISVSFNFTFSAAPLIVMTPEYNGDSYFYQLYIKTKSTTGFTFDNYTALAGTCHWIAIGTPA